MPQVMALATPQKVAGRVLVTRPAHQAHRLVKMLEQQGVAVVRLPCIEIVAPKEPTLFKRALCGLDKIDMAIFISRNAVDSVVTACQELAIQPPPQLPIAAIGAATGRALNGAGWKVDVVPRNAQTDSESLLACLQMHRLKGREVRIFRGQTGRDYLRDGLFELGAKVQYVEAYHRRCPLVSSSRMRAILTPLSVEEVNVITATSVEILENLLLMAGPYLQERLCSKTAVVISRRMADRAKALGFLRIKVAQSMSDEAISEQVMSALLAA